MHKEPESHNTRSAPRIQIREFVARTNFSKASKVIGHVLTAMDEVVVVEPGSREFHQAEAMRAAQNVRHQYTRDGKTKAKRECLSHLIASLARPEAAKKAPSA